MEEEKVNGQKIKEGEEEKAKIMAYLCQEQGPGTQHTLPTARNPKRLGSLLHRARLKPSPPTAVLESWGVGATAWLSSSDQRETFPCGFSVGWGSEAFDEFDAFRSGGEVIASVKSTRRFLYGST